MTRNKLLIAILIAVLIFGDAECRKKSGRQPARPASRTTPRPRTTTTQRGHGNPSNIGWNVHEANANNRQNSGGVGQKPSAPLPEQTITRKTNGPGLQSGYPGQNNQNSYQPGTNYHGQNQPIGQGYNPPVGQQHSQLPYNPSVGQSYHQPGGQPYNPSVGQPYHQPAGQPYNPSVGQPYHQPAGQPYNPPVGQAYNPPVGQPYQQPIGQPYNPPVGQTVILAQAQPASANRGLGQIAKEAVVFAGVNAGVNAAINRLLPGGSRGSGGGGGSTSTSNTQITYNNYYNNQTDSQGNPMPAAAAGEASSSSKAPEISGSSTANPMGPSVTSAPENKNSNLDPNLNTPSSVIPLDTDTPKPVSPPVAAPGQVSGNPMAPPEQTNLVSDAELATLSEELFKADTNNAFKYITIKLQGQKTDDSVTDSATEPLLTVQPEAMEIPTIASLRSLYDKFELDSKVAEKVTSEKREGEINLINSFVATDVMSKAMKFVADKGLIPNDEYEFKDALKRIWFSQYARENNVISSSGFESVFLAEKVNTEITGLHNWIYFNEQESAGKANYLGYIKEAKLGSNAAIIKLRATLTDVVRPVTTIFVGTSPELEMALYTVCFFVRPNGVCPVSVGGTPFAIYTSKISYFGKEIMFSAYPEI